MAWVVAQDLIILEENTTVNLDFRITRGDRSVRTRAFAYTKGKSATAGIYNIEIHVGGEQQLLYCCTKFVGSFCIGQTQ